MPGSEELLDTPADLPTPSEAGSQAATDSVSLEIGPEDREEEPPPTDPPPILLVARVERTDRIRVWPGRESGADGSLTEPPNCTDWCRQTCMSHTAHPRIPCFHLFQDIQFHRVFFTPPVTATQSPVTPPHIRAQASRWSRPPLV